MRTHDALERLAAVAPDTESLVGASEEDGILAQILGSPRTVGGRRKPRRLQLAIAVAVAAAVAATIAIVSAGGGSHQLALSGARLQLAGYHFRTPAGFQESSTACGPSATDRFSAAASADGGCVEAFFLISMSGSAVPADATPVDVGAYQGYIENADSSGRTRLYVELPVPSGADINWQAVVLFATGLTSDQLVAIAESGLPATPSATVG